MCRTTHTLRTNKFTYPFALVAIRKKGWKEETKGKGDFVCPVCQLMKINFAYNSRKGRLWIAAQRMYVKRFYSHDEIDRENIIEKPATWKEREEYALLLMRKIRKISRHLKI